MENGVQMEVGWIETIIDMLKINLGGIVGLTVLLLILLWISRRYHVQNKVKTIAASMILCYFFLISLTDIFGIPTLQSIMRTINFGEKVLVPNIELIPLADGFSLSFILNIIVFIPIGFLLPLISDYFCSAKHVMLQGAFISLLIEISQLFTPYRATDINDLITNVLGTLVGYFIFSLVYKLSNHPKKHLENKSSHIFKLLPTIIFFIAFICVFVTH